MAAIRCAPRAGKRWTVAFSLLVVVAAAYAMHAYDRFGEELTGLSGVRLGDGRDEVRYRLGGPPAVLAWPKPNDDFPGLLVYYTSDKHPWATAKSMLPAGTTIDQYPAWDYESADNKADKRAWFDPKTERVNKVECFDFGEPPTEFCQPVLGVRIGDPEERIVNTLGKPASQSIDKAGVKTMEYSDIGVTFLLTKAHVYAVKITVQNPKPSMPWTRFLRWAIHK